MANRIKRNTSDRLFDAVNGILLVLIGIVTLYPFWNILVLSFNNALDTLRGGIYLWPRSFTLDNFKIIFDLPQLTTAFRNSFLRTVIGSVLSVGSTAMLAYVISRRDFIFQKLLQRLFVITMYVSGGLIPIYFVIKGLGLLDNFLVYLIPMLLQPFYLLVTRSYMDGLPGSLQESAQIDGANDFVIFAKIIFPLSMPIIATILLFVAVDQWNAWFDTFIYTTNKNLSTLQYELVKILSQSTASVKNDADLRNKLAGGTGVVSTPQSIRMAITIVATIPIVVVYPFVQKYFVHGMTLGAVKG
ncbi:carbohydrate ABC transporter permease [Gorillibacterium massiliense]|uniref:carbohydrate ABC transporter permease n=1 Tax=Gorillibacterium massiliense TaxID=1280390 RepID=UPI0004B7B090|nr:carbohydrate ABC transporter permease [Gorillibacterium massiliense]